MRCPLIVRLGFVITAAMIVGCSGAGNVTPRVAANQSVAGANQSVAGGNQSSALEVLLPGSHAPAPDRRQPDYVSAGTHSIVVTITSPAPYASSPPQITNVPNTGGKPGPPCSPAPNGDYGCTVHVALPQGTDGIAVRSYDVANGSPTNGKLLSAQRKTLAVTSTNVNFSLALDANVGSVAIVGNGCTTVNAPTATTNQTACTVDGSTATVGVRALDPDGYDIVAPGLPLLAFDGPAPSGATLNQTAQTVEIGASSSACTAAPLRGATCTVAIDVTPPSKSDGLTFSYKETLKITFTGSTSPSTSPSPPPSPSSSPGTLTGTSDPKCPNLGVSTTGVAATQAPLNAAGMPELRHLFLIILENQAEDNTFGVKMPTPYLQCNVAENGAFVPNYWGTSHFSLGNYLTLLSGQSVTQTNQLDCPPYSQIVQAGTGQYNQVEAAGPGPSQGCVYPANVVTLADQLTTARFTYKGYMEDMGNDPTREAATCGQTQPTATDGLYNQGDQTQLAQKGNGVKPTDQYAMRHNPFPYFMSVVNTTCKSHVVPLKDTTLAADLTAISTTANFTWITPNLCNDGHDVPCTAPGDAGNTNSDFSNENAFLMKWVPLITRSPAFKKDGLLIIAYDESAPAHNANVGTDTTNDGSSCCNEAVEIDPNTMTPGQPPGQPVESTYVSGTGGGKTGTLLLSPFIKPGTVSGRSYNHYSTLHTWEDEFGFAYLGFAAYPATAGFGPDVFGPKPARYNLKL